MYILVADKMKPIAKIFTVGESKPLFCEMDELDDEKNRWKEAARWVKLYTKLLLLFLNNFLLIIFYT